MRHWFDSRAFEFEIASEFDFQVDEGAEVAASDRDINLAHNKYYEKYWTGIGMVCQDNRECSEDASMATESAKPSDV